MRMIIFAICAICVLGLTTATAKETNSPPQIETHGNKAMKMGNLEYLLYLPKDYNASADKRWPLMLFLHGAGERGANISKVAKHGPPKLVKKGRDFPFIIVSPQCRMDKRWDNDVLLSLLDKTGEDYRVDKSRVYLTGLSMGGHATWSLGMAHPERFAAIVPICGRGDPAVLKLADPKRAEAIKSLGIWAFHGADDDIVPVGESERMVDALKKFGCKEVDLTIYPDAEHDSWTVTYDNPKLYEWLLAHQRK